MNLLIHFLISSKQERAKETLSETQLSQETKKLLENIARISATDAHTQEVLMNLLIHSLISLKQERAKETMSETQLSQETKKLSENIARIGRSIVSGFTAVRGSMKKCQRTFSKRK